MILKVYDESRDRWVLMDDIAKVSTGNAYLRKHVVADGFGISLCVTKESAGNSGDIEVINTDGAYIPADWRKRINNDERPYFIVPLAFLTMRSGVEQIIAFGGAAYLMNDDGKTIERL